MCVVFQCSIFVGSWVPLVAYFHEDEIPYWYWMLFILAFLLGEWGIFLLYTVKLLEKMVTRMRRLVFNIIKLFTSIALQCYMLLVFPVIITLEWGYKNIISNMITLLGILLGEGGIYLLYTVKPLENEKQNKVYAKAYIGINIIFFGILMYECFTCDIIFDFIHNMIYGF